MMDGVGLGMDFHDGNALHIPSANQGSMLNVGSSLCNEQKSGGLVTRIAALPGT
jgi:hypothetical protein